MPTLTLGMDGLLLDAVRLSLLSAGLILLPLLAVGLLVGMAQAWLNVHDVAVSAAPRWLAGVLAVLVFGPWIAQRVVEFAVLVWRG